MPLAPIQSPFVVHSDEEIVGIGFSMPHREQSRLELHELNVKLPAVSPFLYARRGLWKDVDVGVKFYGIPYLAGGISSDIKYQFMHELLDAAIDLEVALSTLEAGTGCMECWVGTYHTILAVNPGVYVGGEHIYAGARLIGLHSSEQGTYIYPATVGGVALGSSFKVILDVSFGRPFTEESFNAWGLGFQFAWD